MIGGGSCSIENVVCEELSHYVQKDDDELIICDLLSENPLF